MRGDCAPVLRVLAQERVSLRGRERPGLPAHVAGYDNVPVGSLLGVEPAGEHGGKDRTRSGEQASFRAPGPIAPRRGTVLSVLSLMSTDRAPHEQQPIPIRLPCPACEAHYAELEKLHAEKEEIR